ncbi:MAG: pyridoxal phosphate-dependent aminotransferase, partial [Candidatus Nanohaloarchaea archaeon]
MGSWTRDRVRDIELSIRKISEKAREQDECVRFDIGQPSFDTPEHVKEAARGRMEQKQGYTSTLGIEELREAVAKEESMKKGIDTGSEEVMVTAGGMEAIYSVFATVLEGSDTTVFNDPCWGPYRMISEVNGNDWKQVNFFEDGELRDEAREEFQDAEVVVVNTPSNPVGRVLGQEQAREVAEASEEADALLVSDEVYHRLTYGREHISPAQFADESVVIGSMSKNHAMTGWRVGWVTAGEQMVQQLAKASRALVACPPKISQLAAVEALENDSHVDDMRSAYRERRDLVVERMEELGWEFVEPEGAIYAFPRVGRDSWDFCLDMIEKGVAMVPGEPFGPVCDRNVRISFGSTTREEIDRAF